MKKYFLLISILSIACHSLLFGMEKTAQRQEKKIYNGTEEEYIDKVESYHKRLSLDTLQRSIPLFNAIYAHNISFLEQRLQKDSINNFILMDFGGFTPLMLACLAGDLEIVDFLLTQDADVNKHNSRGWTPLMFAAKKGATAIVKQLLEKKASLNVTVVNSGWTALNLAAKNGHKDIVELLVDNGADVTLRSQDRKSVLALAVVYKHKDVVALLLKKKVPLETKDEQWKSPLLLAVESGDEEIVSLLLDNGAAIDSGCLINDRPGNTALMLAVRAGNQTMIDLLLKRGAFINDCNSQGQTAATWAGLAGDEKIVQQLINVGTSTGEIKAQALLGAAFKGHTTLVNTLLKQGTSAHTKASVNIRAMSEDVLDKVVSSQSDYRAEESALTLAVHNGHTEVVKLLLDNGADINYKNERGATALVIAIEKENTELVTFLLNHGASLTISDNYNQTPFSLVGKIGNEAILSLLLERCEDKQTAKVQALFGAITSHNIKCVRILLAMKVDVNTKNQGNTPLIYSIKRGCPQELVALLLAAGAHVNDEDNNSCTALILAVNKGYTELVELLLKNRADTNTCTSKGDTALILAARKHYYEIVKMLVAAGANVNAQNSDGNTAFLETLEQWSKMDRSFSMHPKAIVTLLLAHGAETATPKKSVHSFIGQVMSKNWHEIISFFIANDINIGSFTISNWPSVKTTQRLSSLMTPELMCGMILVKLVWDYKIQHYLADASRYSTNKEWLKNLDLMYRSPKGQTLLMVACMVGHTEIVKGLKSYINEGYLNVVDDYGYSALDYAMILGQVECATALIDTYGHALNIIKTKSSELLDQAIKRESLQLVTALLKVGVKPTIEHVKSAADQGKLFIMFKLLATFSKDNADFVKNLPIKKTLKGASALFN